MMSRCKEFVKTKQSFVKPHSLHFLPLYKDCDISKIESRERLEQEQEQQRLDMRSGTVKLFFYTSLFDYCVAPSRSRLRF